MIWLEIVKHIEMDLCVYRPNISFQDLKVCFLFFGEAHSNFDLCLWHKSRFFFQEMEVPEGQGELNSMELVEVDMVDVNQMAQTYCEWYVKKRKEDMRLKVYLWWNHKKMQQAQINAQVLPPIEVGPMKFVNGYGREA